MMKHTEHSMPPYCRHNLKMTKKAATSFTEGKMTPPKRTQ